VTNTSIHASPVNFLLKNACYFLLPPFLGPLFVPPVLALFPGVIFPFLAEPVFASALRLVPELLELETVCKETRISVLKGWREFSCLKEAIHSLLGRETTGVFQFLYTLCNTVRIEAANATLRHAWSSIKCDMQVNCVHLAAQSAVLVNH
jgi:hypothetical protein